MSHTHSKECVGKVYRSMSVCWRGFYCCCSRPIQTRNETSNIVSNLSIHCFESDVNWEELTWWNFCSTEFVYNICETLSLFNQEFALRLWRKCCGWHLRCNFVMDNIKYRQSFSFLLSTTIWSRLCLQKRSISEIVTLRKTGCNCYSDSIFFTTRQTSKQRSLNAQFLNQKLHNKSYFGWLFLCAFSRFRIKTLHFRNDIFSHFAA